MTAEYCCLRCMLPDNGWEYVPAGHGGSRHKCSTQVMAVARQLVEEFRIAVARYRRRLPRD